MGTTAIREYEEKVVNQAKSPGPVYKPNYKAVQRENHGSTMGTLASRGEITISLLPKLDPTALSFLRILFQERAFGEIPRAGV
eukprot:UN18155